MPFAYYKRLSAAQKRIYRRSDEIVAVPLPKRKLFVPLVRALELALEEEDRAGVQEVCRSLVEGMNRLLGTPAVRVRVLAVRPHDEWGELHGCYEPAGGRRCALITVWMRTARRKRVTAFRTFLRTLLHEFCHHLDYELLGLEESFHTEGFFKRESSLFRQLTGH